MESFSPYSIPAGSFRLLSMKIDCRALETLNEPRPPDAVFAVLAAKLLLDETRL